MIKVSARRGTFLLIPHMMIGMTDEIMAKLVSHAKKEHCAFIRVCPLLEDTQAHRDELGRLGFRDAPAQMHPVISSILDITRSEDELFANMRKTTRYSIRKAEKDRVAVRMSTDPQDLATFLAIYEATVDRQNFTPFSRKYLETECATFDTCFFFAEVAGEPVSAALIVFFQDTAYYHHGASLGVHPTASYLVQWRAIQEAKRRGCTRYNFWGIVREDQVKHPWYGLSQFKKGFGGYAEAYVPAQDWVLSWRYWIIFGIETVRRIKRRL